MNPLRNLRQVYVVGVGLHRYQAASATNYVSLGTEAVREALTDAAISWSAVDSAYVANTRIGMAAGRPMLRYLGSTGLAITQVENASASGSAAFRQAVVDVAAGFSEVSVAVGVDKPDTVLTGPGRTGVVGLVDDLVRPVTHFALIAQRYIDGTGTTPAQIARVAVKNLGNGARNPYAQRQRARTLDEVLASKPISGVLTALQCTPVGEGAAAVIVMSRDAIERNEVEAKRAVRVLASVTTSEEVSDSYSADVALTATSSTLLYENAGLGPEDIDVVEMHDAFSIEELFYLESMGFCAEGEAADRLDSGYFDIGGRHAVSPSGGLLAMGHPIGPTGVGQIVEVSKQLRGEAGDRQHPEARVGLAHMVGVGAVCIMHMLAGPG